MANKRNNGKKKKGAANPPRRRIAVVPKGPVLDTAAMKYAQLLADPCNGALVQPIYSGAEAGYLIRFKSVLDYGNSLGANAVGIHWTPGYPNSSGSDVLVNMSANPSANTNWDPLGITGRPGASFLSTNASAARCVAACLKVSYPGAESTRSGRISFGHTKAGLIDAGNSLALNSTVGVLQHSTRTTPTDIEVVWMPGDSDQIPTDPAAASSATLRDQKSAVTVIGTGLPADVGLTFHMTVVYEWWPTNTMGLGGNALGKAQSRNTLDHVVDYLLTRGDKFIRMGQMGAGLVGKMANMYGLMPTRLLTY